jgi:predicted membrane-bound spermidine synthase
VVTESSPSSIATSAPIIPPRLLFGVFIISGLSALLYQTIWQRALFMLYGSNVECVAMVVSAFLIGLGLGSLLGGAISQRPGIPLIALFAACELGVGLYGLFSLKLFRLVGELTLGVGSLTAGFLAFSLLLIPTLLMGATLPLLVTHQVLTHGSVGRSVSWLYFVNTLGAALGAFLAAFVWLGRLGQTGSVRLAALLNLLAAALIIGAAWWQKKSTHRQNS